MLMTQLFFINSAGNAVFRVDPVFDQFKRLVDHYNVHVSYKGIYQKKNRHGITCNHFSIFIDRLHKSEKAEALSRTKGCEAYFFVYKPYI